MSVLAFDCSSEACSAAVVDGGRVLARRYEEVGTGHAVRLAPMVKEVMDEAAMAFDALAAVGVTTGPGSFTGVRVALATARGLALALDRPAVGVSSFDALAGGIAPDQRRGRCTVVLVDSRRGDLFVQVYDEFLRPWGEAFAAVVQDLPALLPDAPLLLTGIAAEAAPVLAETGRDVLLARGAACPDAAVVALIVEGRLASAAASGTGLGAPVPLYMRAAAVTVAGGAPPRS